MADQIDKNTEFRNELRSLINRLSMENESNTPDYILSIFLCDVLKAVNWIIREREEWYGHSHKPG